MSERIYDRGIDVLRIISILAVLLIHTTTRHLEITHFDVIHYSFTLLLNQISRFAVPLFFLVSGFVLELNYSEINFFKYLRKRVSRIFIPYLFWSFIYYYFIYTNHTGNFFQALFDGSASYQLYFIPSLFIFYLFFPFLHKIYKIISNKWILVFLFLVEVLILNYDYQYHTSTFAYPIAVALFNYFVFILGMIFARERIKLTQKLKYLWPIVGILAGVTGYFVFNEGKTNYLKTYNFEAFYSQWRPSILIYTILLFLVLYFFANKINLKFIKQLSNLSFFVFFVHIIILELTYKYFFGQDFLFFSVVVFISVLIAYIAHKIPYLTKLTG